MLDFIYFFNLGLILTPCAIDFLHDVTCACICDFHLFCCVCPLGGESVLVVCFLIRDWSPAPVISWMFGIRGPSGQIW